MKYLLFISFTITAFVNATPGLLAARQEECPKGAKVCGIGCIPDSYICCSRESSTGCAPETKCKLGSNDVMGCCPIGETCTGPAPLPRPMETSDLTAAADPTTAIDEPTATLNEGPTTKTTKPDTIEEESADGTSGNTPSKETNTDKSSGDTSESNDSDKDNAGVSNRLDNIVSYLLVGAMVLLI